MKLRLRMLSFWGQVQACLLPLVLLIPEKGSKSISAILLQNIILQICIPEGFIPIRL